MIIVFIKTNIVDVALLWWNKIIYYEEMMSLYDRIHSVEFYKGWLPAPHDWEILIYFLEIFNSKIRDISHLENTCSKCLYCRLKRYSSIGLT